MRILFVCGGTGGHINPALAVAGYLRAHRPDAEILFAGNPDGMESRLVPAAGFAFTPIRLRGIQRQLNWRNFKNNCQALLLLTTAARRSRRILKEFKPDVVLGTGGYVSGPLVREAARQGIYTLTQEQNAFPGVTTRLLTRYVDRVLLAVPEAKERLDPKREYVVTGNPIREEILFVDRATARAALGLSEGQICILSFGGSLGARRINEAVAELVAHTAGDPKVFHIHATGAYGVALFPSLLAEKGIPADRPGLDLREYINDMPACLAAADLVICRAGAITISELEAAGRASILIPSPNVAENHQYHNAMVLARRDAAVVVEEKDLTGTKLCAMVDALIADPSRLAALGRNAASLAVLDANRRIAEQILQGAAPRPDVG